MKLATAERFRGDTECRTGAYIEVRKDPSTGSLFQSPAEVEFQKRSNAKIS
ncbi:MAG: palindromic element RPE1 domain-containing protein [Candidatus Rickettsia vulgarisii]